MERTYARTPTALRRTARQHSSADRDCYRCRLAFRPPYDWDAVLAFLRARATPGVECVDGSVYRRTIAVNGVRGAVEVSRLVDRDALSLLVRLPDPRPLLLIVERVKRMFDLGADPSMLREQLGTDPLLRQPLAAHPGIRTPGAWDAFELAVRAILGQQISVQAATTIAGRIAALHGSRHADAEGLDRLFPTPAQLTHAALEEAGVMPARAETIRALARRVASGEITLDTAGDDGRAVQALVTVPGIGEWTAQYIAMRAFGEPDAFLSGDLVLRRMAGNCTARELERRAEAWRPWRAYAVMLLWQTARDKRRSRDQGAGSGDQGGDGCSPDAGSHSVPGAQF